MLRGIDNAGCIILGLTRTEIEGLLAGKRCCFVAKAPAAPGPHICVWFAETDADLIARVPEMYPGTPPPVFNDYRTQRPLLSLALTEDSSPEQLASDGDAGED